jgi:tryptophan 2,3-dioxygenase
VRYRDYLELDTLLDLQRPRVPAGTGTRVRAAEHLFIIVHQCCELWLAQILLDLRQAAAALAAPAPAAGPAVPAPPLPGWAPGVPATVPAPGSPVPGVPAPGVPVPGVPAAGPAPGVPLAADGGAAELALEHLSRVAAAFGLLHGQVTALDRLPHHCFARFRPYLGTASGAQSEQFTQLDRELGLSGAASPVAEAFAAAVARAGSSLVEVCRAGLAGGALYRVAEVLLEIGQGYWRWKVAHLAVVSRLLGDIGGTAGSTGADHLARRLAVPFPEVRRAQLLAHFDRAA